MEIESKLKETVQQAKKRLRFKSIYIPVIGMSLFVLVLFGILDYIVADLSFEIFKQASYWVNLFISYTSIALMTASTLMVSIDNFTEKNAEYLDIQKKLRDFITNEYRPSLFQKFLFPYNRRRKINAWRRKVLSQLSRLEKRKKEKDAYIWEFGSETDKRKNSYCIARKRLEKQLTNEWIEKNIDLTKVKYNIVTTNLVIAGDSKKIEEEQDDYITTFKALKVAKDKAPMLLLNFAVITLFSSIITEFSFDATFFIKTISKLTLVFSSIYSTIRYSKHYNKVVTLHDILFRWGVCCEYLAWAKAKLEEVEKHDRFRENNPIRETGSTTTDNDQLTVEQLANHLYSVPGS